MNKIKLCALALTLMGSMGGVQAQEDGTYYLYDASTGLFLSRGCNYGTEASAFKYGIPVNITKQTDGTFHISPTDWNGTVYLHEEDNKSSVYTDNKNATAWTLTASGNGYTISADSKYLTHGSGTFGEYCYLSDQSSTVWTLKTPDEYNAMVEAYPTANYANVIKSAELTDVTADNFLTTLSKKTATVTNTVAPSDYKFTGWGRVGWGGNSVSSGSPREIYQCTGYFTYSLTDLQKGIYKVSIPAFERNGSNAWCSAKTKSSTDYEIKYNSNAYITANNEQVRIKAWAEDRTNDANPNSIGEANTSFSAGKYTNEVYTYVGSDGKLDITVAVPQWQGSHWCIFGNTTLTYYSDLSDEQVKAITTKATELSEKKMNADTKSALTTALANFKAGQTADNYNKLSDAVTAAENSVDAYASANTALAHRATLAESTNFYSDEAFKTFYTEPKAAYDNNTLSDADAKALADPLATTSWHAASDQIRNFLGSATGVTAYDGNVPYVNTWSHEGESDGSNFKVPFYEYWKGDAETLDAKTLTLTQTGLEAGTYKVTAWVRTRLSDGKTAPITGISMNVNEGNAKAISGTQVGTSPLYLDNYTAYGTVGDDKTLKLNIVVADETNSNWVSFQNVKYEKVTPVAYDEAASNTITDEKGAYVTMKRTIVKDYWNTFVVPFDLSAEQVKAAFGDKVQVMAYANTEGNTLNFTKTDVIKANTPVLVKADAKTELTFEGVNITAGTPTAEGTNWNFVGTFNSSTAVPAEAYMLQNNGLYKSNGTASTYYVNAFRGFFQPNTTAAAKPMLNIDGTTTGIDKVVSGIDNDGNVYNLAGQKVGKSYKGLLIKNGKKYMNK